MNLGNKGEIIKIQKPNEQALQKQQQQNQSVEKQYPPNESVLSITCLA